MLSLSPSRGKVLFLFLPTTLEEKRTSLICIACALVTRTPCVSTKAAPFGHRLYYIRPISPLRCFSQQSGFFFSSSFLPLTKCTHVFFFHTNRDWSTGMIRFAVLVHKYYCCRYKPFDTALVYMGIYKHFVLFFHLAISYLRPSFLLPTVVVAQTRGQKAVFRGTIVSGTKYCPEDRRG